MIETATCERPCCRVTDEDRLHAAGLHAVRWTPAERVLLGALLARQGRYTDLAGVAMEPSPAALRQSIWRLRRQCPAPWCIDTLGGSGVYRLHDDTARCEGRPVVEYRPERKVTADQLARAEQLHAGGMQWRDVATALGVRLSTLGTARRLGTVRP